MGKYQILGSLLVGAVMSTGCSNAEPATPQTSGKTEICPEYKKHSDERINEVIDAVLKEGPKYDKRFSTEGIVKFMSIGLIGEKANECRKSFTEDGIYELSLADISCSEANTWPSEMDASSIIESNYVGAKKEDIALYPSRFSGMERAFMYDNKVKADVANKPKYAKMFAEDIVKDVNKKPSYAKKPTRKRVRKRNNDFRIMDDEPVKKTKRSSKKAKSQPKEKKDFFEL